jgi:hypothetical protein
MKKTTLIYLFLSAAFVIPSVYHVGIQHGRNGSELNVISEAVAPDPKDRVPYSPEIEAGKLNMDDVIKPIYEDASKALGKEFKYPSE